MEHMIGGAVYLNILLVVALYVFVVVVAWRFMRAHESIAESMRIIAQNLKREP